ncbi:MAG: hypothetical protein AVDCRST_MAG11-257, partial [uncultured Gemmatimonadaceae bacterium]
GPPRSATARSPRRSRPACRTCSPRWPTPRATRARAPSPTSSCGAPTSPSRRATPAAPPPAPPPPCSPPASAGPPPRRRASSPATTPRPSGCSRSTRSDPHGATLVPRGLGGELRLRGWERRIARM